MANTVLTGTAAALGVALTRNAKRAVVLISGLSSETISVTGHMGTTVYTGKLRPINLNTGAVEATDSDLSNGEFLFDNLAFGDLKFTKSAATEAATVTVNTAV